MAYEFTKLSEVPSIEEFPETANVLIEDNGDIKRCKTDGLGGGNIEVIELTYDGENFTGPTDKSVEEYWEAMKTGTTFVVNVTSSEGVFIVGDTLIACVTSELGGSPMAVGRFLGYIESDGTGIWSGLN